MTADEPYKLSKLTKQSCRKKLGRAIRARRKEKDLTQVELAEIIKTTRSTIQSIEYGNYPSLNHDLIIQLGTALQISPMRLVWEVQRTVVKKYPGSENVVKALDTLMSRLK